MCGHVLSELLARSVGTAGVERTQNDTVLAIPTAGVCPRGDSTGCDGSSCKVSLKEAFLQREDKSSGTSSKHQTVLTNDGDAGDDNDTTIRGDGKR